jgi:hypothetical protein
MIENYVSRDTQADLDRLRDHFERVTSFWDRDADERAAVMRGAAERGGVENFFDLSPDERAQAYDRE